MFFTNSATVGFSFALPACRWHPKNFSRGSCDNFSLRKQSTPLSLNKYGIISVNDVTTIEIKYTPHIYSTFVCISNIRMPSCVSALNIICFFSFASNPFIALTDFSHLLKYSSISLRNYGMALTIIHNAMAS